MAKIGDVCVSKIDTLNAAYNGKIDYIDISAVDNREKKITQTAIVLAKDAPSRAKQLVECGDVIVSLVRPNLNAVAIIEEQSQNLQVASTGYCVLRCNQMIYNRYLFYFCQSETFVNSMTSQATGASYPAVSTSIVKNCEVPLPELKRQKSIANTLDKMSAIVFLRKQQIAKLDELVKARFVEMFGDPVKNTMDWEMKPLSELGELNRGVSKARPRNSPELLGGPYPLIQTGEVANAKTYITSFNSTYSEKGLAQSKMWPKGTLCITIAANIAQTSILTFDACFPDSVVGFISRNMTNEIFIHYWFSFFQKILDEQAPQVAQKNINLKILSELNVIVPPLSLQNRFAAFVERVDQQKQTVQQSLEKLEVMKKALMQEYFG